MQEEGVPQFVDNDYCFACGTQNPLGLHLRFTREEDGICARFLPGPHLQGFAGILHGGVAATVLDDVMNNLVSRIHGCLVITATLEMRFRKPVPVEKPLVCRARLLQRRGRFYRAEAKLFVEGEDEVLVEGTCMMAEVAHDARAGS
ncbi:MAG: hypothetical protein A2Y63_01215 [Candidatus Riflebacteria bacterium RBG_13_59_9]|nr:MAG: hypothetical protein A2Y63_01215 [Candidatus Riflebacteria bacterium RBG_13_59_9]